MASPVAPAAAQTSGGAWQAPLLPVALAVTAGIVLDRLVGLSLSFSLLVLVAGLVSWTLTWRGGHPALALVFLGCSLAGLGAAYHYCRRQVYPGSDIGNHAVAEARLVHLRADLDEEPVIAWRPVQDPLRSISGPDPTVTVVRAKYLKQGADWLPVSGRVQVVITGHVLGLHVGDQVEMVGLLVRPEGPANPGEMDQASLLLDHRIRAQVFVRKTPDGISRLSEGWTRSPAGWLAVVRGWGQRILQQSLGEAQSGLASALLLGEDSAMTTGEWDRYQRNGVIHVLAISGQHLVVLGGFLWLVIRLLGVRRRRSACLVAVFLLTYALLAGGRPPILRSAVTVGVFCGGILLRRPVLPANSFALAWLTVAALNPADLVGGGCQLSFLAVAVLYWGARRWRAPEADPLDILIEQIRPWWQKALRRLVALVGMTYLLTALVWVTAAPLVALHYHLVCPVALLIGPPVLLLGSLALLSGFLLLLSAAVFWPLVPVFAWLTRWSLAGCDWIVRTSEQWPGGHWYLSNIPTWWVWLFYIAVLSFLILEPLRARWRWVMLAGSGWLCIGLISGWARPRTDELRCTFLAVGHGGCTVIEARDRVLLYDAGALGGPEVTRRQIAPFLWERGIHRIDEVFLSHADLDHFNGLPALLDRFAIGQVTCTPSFTDKATPGVAVTLATLRKRNIPVRIVKAGDRLWADEIEMEVLHPPDSGPEGNENARSMVLLVRHAGHSILLTGDLEGPGLQRVLTLPPVPVDVLMAPHHGSRAGNEKELGGRRELLARSQPRVVVSCQGPPVWPPKRDDPYAGAGPTFLGTWPHGAITIHSDADALTVETFRTGQRFVFPAEPAR